MLKRQIKMYHMNKLLKSGSPMLIGLLVLMFYSCQDIYDNPKYKRPEWLTGKLYVQVEENNLTTFKKCLDATQWGNILATTGFYTVFAPTDEAFSAFFQNHPKYKKFEDFLATPEDSAYLDDIVRYHIIQDGWSRSQLTGMAMYGFYDKRFDINSSFYNKPIAYKRPTALLERNTTVFVNENVYNADNDKYYNQIVTVPSAASVERTLIPDANKYAPFFYKAYFDALDYTSRDYEFFFNRPFDDSKIYFAGAEVLKEQIPAENGFLYTIDKVVEPLPNLFQALKQNPDYSQYFKLLNEFADLTFEETKTKEQPGYNEGVAGIKNLYSLRHTVGFYGISLNNEKTSTQAGVAMFGGYSILPPTNQALQKVIDELITSKSGYPHWPTLDAAPSEVKELLVLSSLITSTVYKKDIEKGLVNFVSDSVILTESDIAHKVYCSNGVLVGTNVPIVPRALSSVAGPMYLRPGFSHYLMALRRSGMLDEIKNANKKFSFFAVDDNTFLNDSSLLIFESDQGGRIFKSLIYYDKAFDPARMTGWSRNALFNLITNQVCEGEIEGMATFEFLRTLGGYYLRINNQSQTVFGSSSAVVGINGSSDTINNFVKLDQPTINGSTYRINAFINASSVVNLFAVLKSNGFVPTIPTDETNRNSSYFIELCIKAGLANVNGFIASQISTAGPYTVFAPGDQVLKDYEAFENVKLTSLSNDELRKFLLYHFVQGAHIFTDGKQPSGTYRTLRVDEKSSDLGKVYSTVNIETGYDIIRVLNKSGDVMATVLPENQSNPNATFTRTNKIAYVTIPDPDNANLGSSTFASSVIHEISSVLVYEK
jgi:uncharacterized surface protein with fasciclin (FAS1) repeats